MLDVRLQRRISGSAVCFIDSKACSVYRRKQTPLPYSFELGKTPSGQGLTRTSRPARPARCIAEDFVISLVKSVSNPGIIYELQWG